MPGSATSAIGYQGDLPPRRFNLARYCIGRLAAESPDKIAFSVFADAQSPARHWTYRALDEDVRRIAGGLLAHRLRPGDRVMIRLLDSPEYVLLFFGAIAAGLVPIPVSAQLTDGEVGYLVRDSAPSVVALGSGLPFADDDRKSVRILDGDDICHLLTSSPAAGYADTDADDPAFLIYTSGTSGRPKGVQHAQRNVWGRRPMRPGWSAMRPADIVLHAGSFNWTYTIGVGLMDPWAVGATSVLYTGSKRPEVWPALIQRSGATMFATVPSLYRQILKYNRLEDGELASLRHCLAAGETLQPAILAEWRRRTGLEIYESYGMSECSTFISTHPGLAIRPGSAGKPQPGRAVRLVPVEGGTDEVPSGDTGVIAVHRADPGLMLGYWRVAEQDRAIFRGDWFISSDLAVRDPDGYVWHQGRSDDVMNAGGFRVSPAEVESVLADCPGVAEVAVAELAVRPDVSVIAAFVVAQQGQAVGRVTILEHAASRLAEYKRPREVVFLDRLPRTANGKLQRRLLPRRLADTSS